jgi:shikimate dehydrogenase
MPHKEAVTADVDDLDPAAAALRSVNTVVAGPDGRLLGCSTDGAGFVASLAAAGVDVGGRSVCLLGAGAAARAISDALARAGASAVVVVNRTRSAADEAAALAGAIGSVGTAADIGAADLVVNATSVGMDGAALPCDPVHLRAGQVVADIVYHPRDTPLLRAARAAGARTVDGLGMLVHQAALQQQLWHGHVPDVAAMTAAAERELAARRQ